MYRRLGALAVLGLAILTVFLVFGLDIRNLDELWAAIKDFWSTIQSLLSGSASGPTVPKPPRINLPAPGLPG